MGYMFVLLAWEERYIIRRCSDDEHDLKPMLRTGWREVHRHVSLEQLWNFIYERGIVVG